MAAPALIWRSKTFQAMESALLRRIIRGSEVAPFLPLSLLPRGNRLSNFVHHTILPCCILSPQIQSNRAMGEVQTAKESYLTLLLKYGFIWHMFIVCVQRPEIDLRCLLQLPSTSVLETGSVIRPGVHWLVRVTDQWTPGIHLSPGPTPPRPMTGVTDPFSVLWICTRVRAYTYVAGTLQTKPSFSPKHGILLDYV